MMVVTTIGMLKADLQTFPDHRLKLFRLLHAMNQQCFQQVAGMKNEYQELYLDTLLWGSAHEHPTVAQMALNTLCDFLRKVTAMIEQNPGMVYAFYRMYYFRLQTDVMKILTDTMHTTGFKLHCQVGRGGGRFLQGWVLGGGDSRRESLKFSLSGSTT